MHFLAILARHAKYMLCRYALRYFWADGAAFHLLQIQGMGDIFGAGFLLLPRACWHIFAILSAGVASEMRIVGDCLMSVKDLEYLKYLFDRLAISDKTSLTQWSIVFFCFCKTTKVWKGKIWNCQILRRNGPSTEKSSQLRVLPSPDIEKDKQLLPWNPFLHNCLNFCTSPPILWKKTKIIWDQLPHSLIKLPLLS